MSVFLLALDLINSCEWPIINTEGPLNRIIKENRIDKIPNVLNKTGKNL